MPRKPNLVKIDRRGKKRCSTAALARAQCQGGSDWSRKHGALQSLFVKSICSVCTLDLVAACPSDKFTTRPFCTHLPGSREEGPLLRINPRRINVGTCAPNSQSEQAEVITIVEFPTSISPKRSIHLPLASACRLSLPSEPTAPSRSCKTPSQRMCC